MSSSHQTSASSSRESSSAATDMVQVIRRTWGELNEGLTGMSSFPVRHLVSRLTYLQSTSKTRLVVPNWTSSTSAVASWRNSAASLRDMSSRTLPTTGLRSTSYFFRLLSWLLYSVRMAPGTVASATSSKTDQRRTRRYGTATTSRSMSCRRGFCNRSMSSSCKMMLRRRCSALRMFS